MAKTLLERIFKEIGELLRWIPLLPDSAYSDDIRSRVWQSSVPLPNHPSNLFCFPPIIC